MTALESRPVGSRRSTGAAQALERALRPFVGGAMAFRDGRMGVDQILAVRPGPHDLPAVRAW